MTVSLSQLLWETATTKIPELKSNRVSIARALIQKGTSVTVEDVEIAVKHGLEDIIEEMKEHAPDIVMAYWTRDP
jgi:hypothetical protein